MSYDVRSQDDVMMYGICQLSQYIMTSSDIIGCHDIMRCHKITSMKYKMREVCECWGVHNIVTLPMSPELALQVTREWTQWTHPLRSDTVGFKVSSQVMFPGAGEWAVWTWELPPLIYWDVCAHVLLQVYWNVNSKENQHLLLQPAGYSEDLTNWKNAT